jgi:hypothetical protein
MASRKKKQKLEKVVNGKPVRYSVDVPHMQICCDCGLINVAKASVKNLSQTYPQITTYVLYTGERTDDSAE